MKQILLALAVFVLGSPATAFVLGGKIEQQHGTGVFEKLDTSNPFSVGADNFDSCNLFAFDEDQNILLSKPVRVDVGGKDGVIAEGSVVASHYVFFDSINGYHAGYVDFDAPVLGIATRPETLDASDFLANTEVTYISTNLRGLETGDYVWIDPNDPFRIWVAWAGSSPGDYIRVFTSKSPGV